MIDLEGQFGEREEQLRLRYFGHVQRRGSGCIGNITMKMELASKRE